MGKILLIGSFGIETNFLHAALSGPHEVSVSCYETDMAEKISWADAVVINSCPQTRDRDIALAKKEDKPILFLSSSSKDIPGMKGNVIWVWKPFHPVHIMDWVRRVL